MGTIADRFASAFRDFVTAGVPASGANEPSKSEIRAIGQLLDQLIGGAVTGLRYYTTKALMDEDTTRAPGTIAYVYDDSTSANNGVYHYEPGGWVVDTVIANTFAEISQTPTGDKNLFDPAAAQSGFEVQFTGAVAAEANSIVSEPMYVGGAAAISISGLANNPSLDRVYAFYSGLPANATTFVAYGQISGNSRLGIPVPAGANYVRLSPKQRQSGSVSIAAVQVETGFEATAFQTFTPRVGAVLGDRLGDRPEPQFVRSAEYGGGVNLFDPAAAVTGQEIQYTGSFASEADSVRSGPMYVADLDAVTISGLAANPALDRVYAFYTDRIEDGGAFVSYGLIVGNSAPAIPVPATAKVLYFCPKQRQTGTVSIATAQVEPGRIASPYHAFEKRVVAINGMPVGRDAGVASTAGIVAIFGDSITQTEDVDNAHYAYGSGYRANWPDHALPLIAPVAAYNFAHTEAAFANYSGATNFKKFQYQIDTAIALGVTFDTVIVALGINDQRFNSSAFGDYTTAMGKAFGSLDLTVSIEAARAGFYRLQQAWPDAVKFVSLPLQNGQTSTATIKTWNDLIARMAGRYGFTVIDAFSESGIVADFENTSTAGQDLYDGLHTDASGQRKQGRLIAARVRSRLFG